MIVLPAIDLYGGKVVRLSKGDFSQRTDYEVDPCEAARRFLDEGCSHLHIVDLEGAKTGEPKHLGILSRIAELGLCIEYGGGLRTPEAIRDALNAGSARVMVGSLLFRSEDMPRDIFSRFGVAVMPSIDVRQNKVVHSGWLSETDMVPNDCLRMLRGIGYKTFLVTGVERDGMLAGPDLDLYRPLVGEGGRIVAAGGVTTVGDIENLKSIGLSGAVIGKALYEKDFDLGEALRIAGDQHHGVWEDDV